jgi:elongation factor 1-alpha
MAETKIALITAGHVDSGKSTLVGVLANEKLDDGNGMARNKVVTHPHELETGRTSFISSRTAKIYDKVLSFYDLCGHEKYLKTTLYGITAYHPDYAIITVAANNGVELMTKKHFEILCRLNLPILIIITKVDMVHNQHYKNTLKQIEKMVKNETGSSRTVKGINNYQKKETNINEEIKEENKNKTLYCLKDRKVIPIISVSNKTGYYIDVLKNVLYNLDDRDVWNNNFYPGFSSEVIKRKEKVEKDQLDCLIFYIDRTFNVKNVGFIVSGIVRKGKVSRGDTLKIGPIENQMIPVKVKSIHNNFYQDVETLGPHDRGCLCIVPVNKKEHRDYLKARRVKGGSVVTDHEDLPRYYHFKAVIQIENNSVNIKTGYHSMVYMSNIKHVCKVILPDEMIKEKKDLRLRAGDVNEVLFKFTISPKFIEKGLVFLFRCGKIHGYGFVTDIIPIEDDNDAKPEPLKK